MNHRLLATLKWSNFPMVSNKSTAVSPSNSREASRPPIVPQPQTRSRIVTRSISKSQKRKFLPFRDPSLSISVRGCPALRDMLHKQYLNVLNRRDRPGKPDTKDIDLSTINIIHGRFRKDLTPEARDEALTKLGVIWSNRPPLTHDNFNKPEEEYYRSKALAQVVGILAEMSMLELTDLIALLCVSHSLHKTLVSAFPLRSLDFSGKKNGGDHLVAALSLARYNKLEQIDLASARGIENKHLKLLRTKEDAVGSLEYLKSLNLDYCGNISYRGVQDITSTCPRLEKFSICGNLKVTDFCIKALVKNCKSLTDLNLSGCKYLTDDSFKKISNACHRLEKLNINRCERVTDAGVIAIAEGCPYLQFVSLSEIPGVTDRCLEALSEWCSNTLTTLNIDGCTGIEKWSREQLLQLFPNLQ